MNMRFLLLVAIGMALLPSSLPAFDDIQILPSRIKLDSPKNRSKDKTNVESKNIAYSVKVTSSSFKELASVTVRYNIFYRVAELGSKGEPDIKLSTGSHTIPSLLTNKPVEFETDPIKLEKATLDPGWYFDNGASASTQDKVVGVWLKAFDSTGKQIGEYANPSTVTKKQKWKD